jgi:hypothetical protein
LNCHVIKRGSTLVNLPASPMSEIDATHNNEGCMALTPANGATHVRGHRLSFFAILYIDVDGRHFAPS